MRRAVQGSIDARSRWAAIARSANAHRGRGILVTFIQAQLTSEKMLARPTARVAPLATLAFMFTTACFDCKAQSGLWDVALPCAAVKQHAQTLRIAIVTGRCAAPGAVVYDQSFGVAEPGPVPPDLGPGGYAFSAEANGGDGKAIGRGCTDVTLPDSRSVHIAIGDLAGLCLASDADSGTGVASDAGALGSDAAALEDTATNDAGPGDAGPSLQTASKRAHP
jgi:hypothetical protein